VGWPIDVQCTLSYHIRSLIQLMLYLFVLRLIAQYGSRASWPPTLEGSNSDTDDYRFATARRLQYCSFTWKDLWVIAPWLREGVTVEIDGPGLGTRI